MTKAEKDTAGSTEQYQASIVDARRWARDAQDGDYLVEYEDTGMSDDNDVGSRCGYDDQELDEIQEILGRRGLTLRADDVGLVAVEASE